MESKIIYGIVVALCIASIPSAYAEFTFDFEFDPSNSRDKLTEPTDVILDSKDSNVYVVDKGSHRISVFNNNNYKQLPTHHGWLCDIANLSACTANKSGTNNNHDGQFNGPTSIAKNKSSFFVVDSDNHRVQIFDNSWKFVSAFGSDNSNSADYFNSAAGIAFQDLRSEKDRIIVSDSVGDSISVFDLDGVFKFNFKLSNLAGQKNFNGPTNMVVDNNRLYISDTGQNRIVILDLKNNCSSGSAEIRAGVCFVDVFGSSGAGEGEFRSPRGLAFDSTDDLLYVADSGNDRIQVFEMDSNNCSRADKIIDGVCFIEEFGSKGTGNGKFNRPIGITLDSRGEKLYVADSGNDRIQVFDLVISPSSSSSSSSSSSTSKPTGLKAIPISDTSIFLSWDEPNVSGNAPRISGYSIEYRTTSGQYASVTDDTASTATSFVHNGLDPNNSYSYRVYSIDSDGKPSSASSGVTATPKHTQMPTLFATITSPTSVVLSWFPPSEIFGQTITSYTINKVFSNGKDAPHIKDISSRTLKYTLPNLETDEKYIYNVVGKTNTGSTPKSNTVTVTPKRDSNETFKDPTSETLIPTTKPAPPTRLIATSSSSTQIDLKWNLPTSDGNDPIKGYQIEVKEGTGEYETLVSNTRTADRTYTHKGVTPEIKYTYKISAVNNIGTSDASNESFATPKAPVIQIASMNAKSVDAGRSLSFKIHLTSNSVSDGVVYSLEGGPPTGSKITTVGGTFSWTPTDSDAGKTYTFDVVAKKGSLMDKESISITVNKKVVPTPAVPKELGIALFVDEAKGPQSYVDRYNNEPNYKAWFDENFSQYDSIYQAVGLKAPAPLAKFVEPAVDPQRYVDRYNNEPNYKAWFDENFSQYDSIYQAVGLKDPAKPEKPTESEKSAKSERSATLAVFVDPAVDPQGYVDRYNSDPAYKTWFDENFSEFDSIYEAVGLKAPVTLAVFVDPAVDPQGYVDRYNSDPAYKTWFDENFSEFDSIYEAVGLKAPVTLAVFVDPAVDPQGYVDRYNNDPAYKTWFDENFSEFDSIYEAVGLKAPVTLAVFVDPAVDPQGYVDRYNNDPAYKAWFDENFPDYDSIYQAVGLSESITTQQPTTTDPQKTTGDGKDAGQCGEGTEFVDGECVLTDKPGTGSCLIATAAYGSEMAPQVQLLREIRDNQLMGTSSGTSFMAGFNQMYYSFSPYIADMQRESPIFKEAVRVAITPLLSSLSIMSYAESESEVLGYGIGVILVNLGMYIAAPAIVLFKARKYIKI